MKKNILVLSLVFTCAIVVQAQSTATSASGQGESQNSAAAGAKSVNLESNTSLTAQLQNTIDARKAKVGDQVVLKTTKALKSEGRTVVGKGARLIGHVSEVAQRGRDGAASRVGIIFDRIEHGALTMPISATITSVTSAAASADAGRDDMFGTSANGSSRSSSSASTSGGLLGGVGSVANSTTSTLGSAVGNTTAAVGSTVNSTTNAVGGTSSGLRRTLGHIRISESSSASAEGSSVLSLQGDNLRLEKGTSFNLRITQSAGASTNRDQ